MDCKTLMVNTGACDNRECCCEVFDACQTKKCVRFAEEAKKISGPCGLLPPQQRAVCSCCQEAAGCREPCLHSGRPVLVYELPKPKFCDVTTNKTDFDPKPLPKKEVPPWHPIHRERWKALDVPSLNKTTHQTDYVPCMDTTPVCPAPPEILKCPRKEKEKPPPEPPEPYKLCKKTTKGECHTHNICDKTKIKEGELCYIGVEPVTDPPTGAAGRTECPPGGQHGHGQGNQQGKRHGPDCEKYCFQPSLMCHDRSQKVGSDCYESHMHNFVPGASHSQKAVGEFEPSLKPCLKQSAMCADGYCMDPMCGSSLEKCPPGKFGLCKKRDHSGPQRWWKRGCEEERDPRALPEDCDCCRKTNTNTKDSIKFERGGLIP